MTADLLPCPFCGREAEYDYDEARVVCFGGIDCQARGPMGMRVQAIAAWNRRSKPQEKI